MRDATGIISGLLNVATLIPWVIGMRYGNARPSRVTWFLFTYMSWLLLFASIASGADSSVFWLISSVITSTTIFIFSLFKGDWHRTRLEISCLFIGTLGATLWLLTKDAFYGVYVVMVVDIIAVSPTIKKVRKEPDSEPIISWSMGFVSIFLSLVTIDSLRPVIVLPIFSIFLWHIPVLIPMYKEKIRISKEANQEEHFDQALPE